MWRAEVEGRSGDVRQIAGRDQDVADRCVPVGVDGDLVIEDGAAALTRQIEIGVVRHVDDCRPVGTGLQRHFERVGIDDRIAARRFSAARITLLAVLGDNRQRRRGCVARKQRPVAPAETRGATVHVVRAIVQRELIHLAIDSEMSAGNTVGETPEHRAEVRRLGDVVVERRAAEDDRPSGDHDVAPRGAERQNV